MISTFKFPDPNAAVLDPVPFSQRLISKSSLSSLPSVSTRHETPADDFASALPLDYSMSIDHLVQAEVQFNTAFAGAAAACTKLLDSVVRCHINNLLSDSLDTYYINLVNLSRYESQHFASAFFQANDLTNSILENLASYRPSPFGGSLRPSNLDLIINFLALVKDPDFIANVISSLTISEIDLFVTGYRLNSPLDNLASLNRTVPLDILFNTIFPATGHSSNKLDYFSTLCARLIDRKIGEKLCFAVFDKFIRQSNHSSSSALETLILTMLQDGAFLALRSRIGTSTANSKGNNSPTVNSKGNSSPTCASTTSSPDIAHVPLATTNPPRAPASRPSSISLSSSFDEVTESRITDFLSRSMTRLFEYLNNASAEPIPETFLTFLQQIIVKLPESKRRQTAQYIIINYLFNIYFRRALTCPELLGILNDYFLSESQRQRILNPVFDKLYKLMVSAAYYSDQSPQQESLHEAKQHLESLISRLMTTDEETRQPLPSLHSSEYNSFIVVSPADIYTLYRACFPITRLSNPSKEVSAPQNFERQIAVPAKHWSFMFSPSSSGSSTCYTPRMSRSIQPYPTPDFVPLDMNSLTQLSIAETEPSSIDDETFSGIAISEIAPVEDLIYDLKQIKDNIEPAIDELMSRFHYLHQREHSTFMQSVRNSRYPNLRLPHPSKEKWQIFSIMQDGTIQEVFQDSFLDEVSSWVDISPTSRHKPDSEIIFLEKCNVLLPTNRGLLDPVEGALKKLITEFSLSQSMIRSTGPASSSYLTDVLKDALNKSVARGQFLDGNEYSNALQCLDKILLDKNETMRSQNLIAINNCLISQIGREKESNLNVVKAKLAALETRNIPFEVKGENARKKCQSVMELLDQYKMKVWYANEVRSTQLWKRAREVVLSLTFPHAIIQKDIKSNEQNRQSNSSNHHRNSENDSAPVDRQSNSSILRRFIPGARRDHFSKRLSFMASPSFSMFVSKDWGIENKLSDREVESTSNWLIGQKIQNLCQGEERVHRFCCEVDDLVKRIMGDAITGNRNKGRSILTSSPLFRGLWKKIIEMDGPCRTSTYAMSAAPQRSSFSQFAETGEDSISMRRSSSDRPPTGTSSSVGGFHRSHMSSSNLFDMLSTFEMGSRKSIGSEDSGFESAHWSASTAKRSSRHSRYKSFSGMGALRPDEQDPDIHNSFIDEEESFGEIDIERETIDLEISELQMRLISLIYTDLGVFCWSEGSETDKWFNSSLVQDVILHKETQRKKLSAQISSAPLELRLPSRGRHVPSDSSTATVDEKQLRSTSTRIPNIPQDTLSGTQPSFKFDDAYRKILMRLSVNPSPIGKLNTLHELEMLVVSSLTARQTNQQPLTPGSARSGNTSYHRSVALSSNPDSPLTHRVTGSATVRMNAHQSSTRQSSISTSVAGSLASLGSAVAMAEARRSVPAASTNAARYGPNTDMIAEELRRVLSSPSIKSGTIFRDMQLIAAFVTPEILDMTDAGKAFWDVSLALLSLKEDTIATIVNSAQVIFQHNTGMLNETGPMALSLSKYSLADCSKLWSIAAREGDSMSQRELALMLMSHPEITPKCLLPFSKAGEVFDASILADSQSWKDDDKADPIRMAVINHLMTNAASYGDVIAIEYLKQSDPTACI